MITNAGSADQVTTESIATGGGLQVTVEKRFVADQIQLLLKATPAKNCVLHWGIRSRNKPNWTRPPEPQWPQGSTAVGSDALQTPFQQINGQAQVSIELNQPTTAELVEFALYFPDEGRWDNNNRRNYRIVMPLAGKPPISAEAALKQKIGSAEVVFERAFDVDEMGQLATAVIQAEGNIQLLLLSDIPGPLILHWGIARRSPTEWLQPPETIRPPSTVLCGGQAAQTTFETRDGFNELKLVFPENEPALGIQFVLKQGTEGRWLKRTHGNFHVPLKRSTQPGAGSNVGLEEFSNRIVGAETSGGSWTLMHRYNLCFDLLEQARGNIEALGLLYVWLRFSAIRQLTWQRNYNTKPRELAHAQDRLTNKLAELYGIERNGRRMFRLMLATIGRGGDGQRIRDEILQIMHRHHVKEVSGHFLEEWHQKLHNNTTPDDIVICEAYLEFLRSNGNRDRFYQVLQAGGVTKERLESFERPIRTAPDFVGHLKDTLLHDFGNFLKILNAVHSSMDLETAINSARDRLDGETQGLLWEIWNHRNDSSERIVSLVGQITEARRRLSGMLDNGRQLRPLLYLDLALEQMVRVVVERNAHQHLTGETLVALIDLVLENVTLGAGEQEPAICLHHWQRLSNSPSQPQFSASWSLHAKAVVDRIGRALSESTDRLYSLLQPKAEFLGQAFNAEPWTISLFSEEVVRGSSLGFVLAVLLQQVGRLLRQSAHLGDWQIVSRGRGTGKVETVQALREIQGKTFPGQVVVIAEKVFGDEELPKEVVAVIAPDVTDLVSHVAVRARNAQVLFASCSEPALLEQLRSLNGRLAELESTAAGDVVFKEVAEAKAAGLAPSATKGQKRARPSGSAKFAVGIDEFNDQVVGAKSCSQAGLRGKLPDWVRQPASLALPFGTFEKVLALKQNEKVTSRYAELVKQIKQTGRIEVLGSVKECVLSLSPPDELPEALQGTFQKADLAWVEDWDAAWRAIRAVWASKWNERAFLSRKRIGLSDEDLMMAVLIQPVVEADYAFVLHTVNPSSGNRDELYGEIVLGLGETLVGNFPGRALSFLWDKRAQQARIVSFPSKSLGLYGGGLIFRSDSNGEDLAGYAGAGLYDSILLNPPKQVELDYTNEPLIWDEKFGTGLLSAIGKLGVALELALGSPQDIEGAVAKGEYYVVQSRPQVGLE